MVQRNDERVVASSQNLLLCQCAFDLVPLDHFFLAQDCLNVSKFSTSKPVIQCTLHSIQSTRPFLTDKVHLSYVSLADQLDFIKACRPDLYLPDFDRIRAVCSPERYGLP